MRNSNDIKPAGRSASSSSGSHFFLKPTQLKVLLIEDNARDQFMITSALQRCRSFGDIAITSVSTVDAARAALASDDFDVIVSDFLLHGECSSELFRTPDIGEGQIATILVTAIPTPAVHAYATHAGATICLGKDDLTPGRLDRTLLRLTRHHDCTGITSTLHCDRALRVDRHTLSSAKRQAYAH